MLHSFRLAAALSVLAVSFFLAPLNAQQCPNTRASAVMAHVADIGAIDDCSVDATIFGVHFTAHGPMCPSERHFFPYHDECLGAVSPGERCEFQQTMPITRLKCECTYGFFWSHLFHPRCECEETGTAGTVDDFYTASCWIQA